MLTRLLILIALAMMGPVAAAQSTATAPLTARELAQGYRDGYVLAKPRADHLGTVDGAEDREGLTRQRKFTRFGGLRLLKLGAGDTTAAAVRRLAATGRYEFVEPDHVRHITTTPNDPDFTQQWALSNTGSNGPGSGIAGADIHATAAWATRTSAAGVIVAVIDTGVLTAHTDINANLWQNPRENTDGYTGDLYGINSINGSGNPNDDNGHGTHVSGILGAVGNNGNDISGVAWQVQIMALKFLDSSGNGITSNEITCIDFAIAHNANLINASFGSSTYDQAEYTAIQAAGSAGIVFVAAAGNVPEDNDLTLSYPASYLLDNIVAVGCSDNRDDLAYFSSSGSGLVELFAPGYDILSLYNSSITATATLSGTSMSTPMVTGSLALLKAQFPGDTYRQSINRLLGSVDPKINFLHRAQTGGRLDLAAALTSAAGANTPFNDSFASRAHLAGPTVAVRTNNTGATREAGEPIIAGNPGGASLWWDWTAPATGNVTVTTSTVAGGNSYSSSYPTLVGVYTGTSVGALTAVASNSSPGNGASNVTFAAQAGTTYEITVDGQNGATGLTLLAINYANDAFESPATLTGASVGITASNANASTEAGEPRIMGNPGGHSLWYKWTAPATKPFQVSAFSLDFDPLLGVYTGSSLTALTLVASSEGAAISSSALVPASLCNCTFTATAGTTYYITVDGNYIADSATGLDAGQFTLTIADSAWQAVAGDGITCAPTVGGDGTVYVGSDDAYFYAITPGSPAGTVKWKYKTGGALDTSSASNSSDGTTVYAVSEDGYVYALTTSNGALVWRTHVATAPPSCAPTLGADGTIYVKDSGSDFYAIAPATGNLKWTCTVSGISYAAPTIAPDGTIYLGSDNGSLYAVNPATGAIDWTFNAGGAIYTAAAIDSSGNAYFGTLSGECFAVSRTGAQLWTYQTGNSITGSPALGAGGVVYFASYDHNLYALSTASGAVQWTCALGGEVRASSPAIDASGVIYVGCYDNNVYAINPNGSVNRIYATGDWVRSSPVISGGMLYFGGDDHKLYAFSTVGGAGPATSPWPMYLNNAARTGEATAVAPSIVTSPQSATVTAGGSATFSVAAYGSGPFTYQWLKGGTPISGATAATYTIGFAQATDAGSYSVTVTNSVGASTSGAATLAVNPSGRLVDISTRAYVGTGSNILIAGFAMNGTGSKHLLLRGVGPGLAAAPFYLSGTLANPQITLYDSSNPPLPIVTNIGWGNASTLGSSTVQVGPQPATAALMSSVGAFPLATGSADSALEVDAPTGNYTSEISGVGSSTGIALAEIYDADTGAPAATLDNISARAVVGIGGNILIGGFGIAGTTSETVLIRGVGPGLAAAPFSLGGTLAAPQLTLYDNSSPALIIAANTGWGNSPTLGTSSVQAVIEPASAAVMTLVGAFPLATGSADCALVATLPPGNYTVEISGVGSSTGIALVEIYAVP